MEREEKEKVNCNEYKPQQTEAHTSEDVPTIRAIEAYLENHTPEQLLRCIASAAIEAGRDSEGDKSAGLGWLAWKANAVADGEI